MPVDLPDGSDYNSARFRRHRQKETTFRRSVKREELVSQRRKGSRLEVITLRQPPQVISIVHSGTCDAKVKPAAIAAPIPAQGASPC